MDTLPLYVQIGAILGILSSIVLLIIHMRELVATIRLFTNWLNRQLRWQRAVFKEWRWWKQYRPSCEIVNIGKLIIKKPSNRYYLGLKIDVRYTSRDTRYDTSIDITSVKLDVYNKGKGRDSKPYRLSRSLIPLRIFPAEEDNDGWTAAMADIWSIPSGGNVVVRYTFEGFINAAPLIGASTFCEIVDAGKARIEGTSESRPLRIGHKFSVIVDKKYEEQTTKPECTA